MKANVQHFGAVVVKPEKVARYKELPAAVWPEVLAIIKRSRIQNYSFYPRTRPAGLP